jgi:hypothetical protein
MVDQGVAVKHVHQFGDGKVQPLDLVPLENLLAVKVQVGRRPAGVVAGRGTGVIYGVRRTRRFWR